MKRGLVAVVVLAWLGAMAALVALEAKGVGQELPQAYLAAWLVLVSLPLGSLPILMALDLAGPTETVVGPPLRLLLASLPILSLLIAPTLLDESDVYGWAAAKPDGFAGRWFSPDVFALRSIAYLVIWNALALFFLRPAQPTTRHRAIAGLGLLLHLVVGTLAAFDWFMSLDNSFVSSSYGTLVITAQCAIALTAALFIARLIDRRTWTERAPVFALLLAIGLAALAQAVEYLVIWSANLPNEIAWYQTRAQDALGPTFAVAAPVLLALAFLMLLSPSSPRRSSTLAALVVILLVEITDLLCLASPRDAFTFSALTLDLVLLVGIAGVASVFALLVADRRTLVVPHG